MAFLFDSQLAYIRSQKSRMCDLVIKWASINSGSHHLSGLEQMADTLTQDMASLGAPIHRITLPSRKVIASDGTDVRESLGAALSITQRPNSSLRVFLAIHMDTVYPPESPFRTVEEIAPGKLQGPGVIDAKGGLAVMLLALETLEHSPWAKNIGWEVLINPDEEIGSPGSSPILAAAARRNHLGMVFEPALPDGNLVSDRKGSGNFTLIVHGRSAHAGRDITVGRNAITALADVVTQLDTLCTDLDGVTVNVARIDGGGYINVVPDKAICHFNIRVKEKSQRSHVRSRLDAIVADINAREGYSAELHGEFHAPPRIADEEMLLWLNRARQCATEVGFHLGWQPSGGTCDGNRLSAHGLPTLDTLGPVGGNIHSPQEFLLVDSLVQRASLTALLLLKLAVGEYA